MRKNKIDIKSYLEEVKAARTNTSAPVKKRGSLSSQQNNQQKEEIQPYNKYMIAEEPSSSLAGSQFYESNFYHPLSQMSLMDSRYIGNQSQYTYGGVHGVGSNNFPQNRWPSFDERQESSIDSLYMHRNGDFSRGSAHEQQKLVSKKIQEINHHFSQEEQNLDKLFQSLSENKQKLQKISLNKRNLPQQMFLKYYKM